MALAWSGSNGGITANHKRIAASDLHYEIFTQKHPYSMEISYFINNICNLGCRHCYVGYEENKNALSVDEWKSVFDELISIGALTFGNVGKEPVLAWNETRELLLYFKKKRQSIPKLRFGFVTNATLLDRSKIEELERIRPDYIDISLDGTKDAHDYIRGAGNYDRTMKNLKLMSEYEVIEKVFISFTANKFNIATIEELADSLYNMGVKKMLISPYITRDRHNRLYLSNEEIIKWVEELLAGNVINFTKYQGLNIYIKNDYSTTLNLMEKLVNRGIIDKNNLLVDDYGVIFNKYMFNENDLYFNYLPWDDFFVRAIRISHDGYVSNCFDMFFSEYPERAIGNVREKSIREILLYDIPLLKAAI
jgi:sulfatase maturation enzyme AslB (radical SAM superfamily)